VIVESYPFGRAPFWLTVIALVSSLGVVWAQLGRAQAKPDLVLAFSAPNHLVAYQSVATEFEKEHGIDIALQLVNLRALTTRLQSAMLAGTEVPDLAELPFDAMAYFGRGPVKDIGFMDLTERLQTEGYRERLVEARLSLWSTRGHVFALPHDVHPVMLAYRADLVEQLGIDVEALKTWDDFVAVGRRVTADFDGDGAIDRFMIDLMGNSTEGLPILLLQRGVNMFDERGELTFNQPLTVDTLLWYLHQTFGRDRIAYDCGWGQPLAKAMADGLVLFHVTPDWRTHVFEMDSPQVAGKMKLMPLPAWEPGGRRASVWGGSGLAVTLRGKDPELSWQFAKELYFDKTHLGSRYLDTGILPALKDAWDLPEFDRPNPYFSGQHVGKLYASLGSQVPPLWMSPYTKLAQLKLNEVLLRAAAHQQLHGDVGLRDLVVGELNLAEAYIRRRIARNVLSKL
jgi:arabinosaccharide transport system substrate-binding protein